MQTSTLTMFEVQLLSLNSPVMKINHANFQQEKSEILGLNLS